MSIFKTKKFILTTLIFIILTTFSLGMLQVFNGKNAYNNSIYALEGVTEKSKSDWKGGPDSYSCSVKGGILSSKTATLQLEVEGLGKLIITYTNANGTLSITNSNSGFSFDASGNPTTEQQLEIGLGEGVNIITIKCVGSAFWGKGEATIKLIAVDKQQGIANTTITQGYGILNDPFIIDEKQDLLAISSNLNASYKVADGVEEFDFSDGFTQIGSSTAPFTGNFEGNGITFKNITVSPGDGYGGVFASTNGASISNLNIENIVIANSNGKAFSNSGFVVGVATGGTKINSVVVSGKARTGGTNIGGLVGSTDEEDGVVCSNCKVYGEIYSTSMNIGGFSGVGGTFINCEVYANITGNTVVGGFVGGYQVNSSFTDCVMAGTVCQTGAHTNNYPYFAILTGYGAWSEYELVRSGQLVNFSYTTTEEVSAIDIFNSNQYANGLSVEIPQIENGKYTFEKLVTIDKTNADTSYMNDEYNTYGILGNYGGFTIRFTMADGTFKYISTLDKAENKFVSTFEVNLQDLTSYENNFSSIEIEQGKGTSQFNTNSNGISIWGAAKISNANDLEHLSWVVNGAIPTTFKDGIYYNARTITTLSLLLTEDIDLTTQRTAAGGKALNKNSQGNMIYQFYGFGKNEMYPYRGCLYGEGHTLKVHMDFENAYSLGILCMSTEDGKTILVDNIRIQGLIKGGHRVGIIGMNDNYSRQGTIKFNKVINDATITAKSHVGAFMGMAQGGGKLLNYSAEIIFVDCVNNGTITATAGCAGGFFGNGATLKNKEQYTQVTLKNCTNNGKVQATTYAGGFVGVINNTVKLEGINTNSGIVIGSTAKYYVGSIGSGSYQSTTSLRTVFKINTAMPSTSVTATASGASLYNSSNELCESATYTADELGVIYVQLSHIESFEGVTLNIITNLLTQSVKVVPTNANTDNVYADENTIHNYKNTLATFVVLPKAITINQTSVFVTNSSDENWQILGTVEFNNSTKLENVELTINLTEDVLKTNQLVFNNVQVTYSTYKFPLVNLQRITEDVESYVQLATNLKNKESGTTASFTELGTQTLLAYNNIYNQLKEDSYSSDLDRFNSYISNTLAGGANITNEDVSKSNMDAYFSKIVQEGGINKSQLQNCEIEYGKYSFDVEIEFEMLIGSPIKKTLNYTFTKEDINKETLKVAAKTSGVAFDVNGIVTCSFAEDVEVKINKIDILLVSIPQNVETVYNGEIQSVGAVEFELLPGDEIETYTLTYNAEDSAIDVGEYQVEVKTISGKDAAFYNIPENYEKGLLKITPLKYSLVITNNEELIYNKTEQSYEFTLNQTTNNYQIKEADYKTIYSGTTDAQEEYLSESKPTDAGNYTATVNMININLQFANQNSNSFNFRIEKQFVESIDFNKTFKYTAKTPQFGFAFDESFDLDSSNFEYEIYDKNGLASDAVNVGVYTLHLTGLGNTNYSFNSVVEDFEIMQAEVELKLLNQRSIYGDEISLDCSAFTVQSGSIYALENGAEVLEESEIASILGVKLSTNATNLSNVGEDYTLNASYTNSNYLVTITPANYIVEKRVLIITFTEETTYNYSATSQYEKIKPTVEGLLDVHKDYLAFSIKNVETGEQEFQNAGTYVLSLVDNEIYKNYAINQTSEIYSILKQNLTIKPKDFSAAYKQEITMADFEVLFEGLVSPDTQNDIGDISFNVTQNGTEVGYVGLEHGAYTIEIELTEKQCASNYIIDIQKGVLTINLRSTYISHSKISSKIYDGLEISIVAQLVDMEQVEIENSKVEITITKDGETTQTIKDAGKYKIHMFGSAGENDDTATVEYEFEIYKIKVTTTVEGKTYDTKEYVPEFTYSLTQEIDGFDEIFKCRVLDINKQPTTAKNAGDYFLGFYIDDESKNNFEIVDEFVAFKIKTISLSIKVENQSIEYGESFDMEQSAYTIINGELLKEETLNLVYLIIDYSGEVGEYVLTAQNQNANYSVSVTDGIFKVEKRQLDLSVEGNTSLTYSENGYEDLIKAMVSNTLGEQDVLIYYTDSTNKKVEEVTDAGNYTLVIMLNDSNNFKFASGDETKITYNISVEKKTLELTILAESKQYDGVPLTLSKVVAEGKELTENVYSIEFWQETKLSAAPKNVGVYDIVLRETEDSKNYIFTKNTIQLEISLREISIKEIDNQYTYTRTAIQPKLELENVVNNEDVKLNYDYINSVGNFKEVGDYKIEINGISGLDASNYLLIADEEILYSIIPAQVDVVVNNNVITFSNKQVIRQDLNIEFSQGLKIIETDYSLSTLPRKAGEYEIDLISLNSGIVFNISSFKLIIEKAVIDEVSLESKTVVFNNQVHSLAVNKTTLSNGVEVNVQYSNNENVNAGTYAVYATLSNENYITKTLEATLVVEQATISVPLTQEDSFDYDKNQHGLEILNSSQLWYNTLILSDYVGENYSSIAKPTRAGTYYLRLSPINENNIKVENYLTKFEIKTKAVTITSIQQQTLVYNAMQQQFNVSVVGVFEGEVVKVKMLYNNSETAPINAGEYEVSFDSLTGLDAGNYHIENKNVKTKLIINPYQITVNANPIEVVYGEEEKLLTYTSTALLGLDVFTGSLEREQGTKVNSYWINQGNLTAGENYSITYIKAMYNITQRTLNYEDFQDVFTYNGLSQVPVVIFTNIVNNDTNVASTKTIGDTINAGIYTLQFVLKNPNYALPEISSFDIVINKKDASEKIVGISLNQADYNGQIHTLTAEIAGGIDYELSYYLEGQISQSILNAGVYDVVVKLIDENLTGQKVFNFTVNKIDYDVSVLESIEVDITSDTLKISEISNNQISVDNQNFATEITNLNSKTSYDVYVKILEDKNHKTTVLFFGKVSTCASATELNSQIKEVVNSQINSSNIEAIKELIKDYHGLSEEELALIEEETYLEFIEKYEEYFNEINQEIQEVNIVSNIVNFNSQKQMQFISTMICACGALLGVIKGRKKDETIN